MINTYFPQARPMTVAGASAACADEIMNALIQQTAQAEYDDMTVDRLIIEYQQLIGEPIFQQKNNNLQA